MNRSRLFYYSKAKFEELEIKLTNTKREIYQVDLTETR